MEHKSKWQEFKEAVKNPSPARLAALEYRSYFANIFGVIVVCSILIYKGLWWVIFALIFGIGANYAQGMNAYKKYQLIKSMQPQVEEKIENFRNYSPIKKRNMIIKYIIGNRTGLIVSLISAIIPYFIMPNVSVWFYGVIYFIMFIAIYIILYFFVLYAIANYFYNKKCKEVSKWEDQKK